jgi:hypothetical protein
VSHVQLIMVRPCLKDPDMTDMQPNNCWDQLLFNLLVDIVMQWHANFDVEHTSSLRHPVCIDYTASTLRNLIALY